MKFHKHRTDAEYLLLLAEMIKFPRQNLVLCAEMEGKNIARIQTALAFDRAPKALQMRAIFEEWDLSRIVREMY